MKKKIILSICGVCAGILLFGGGFFCGLKFFSWNWNISALTESRIALLQLITNIEALDRKDYDSLRTSLNMGIDGEILKIYNTIGDSKSKDDIDKAKKSLSRLAKHRQKYPATYPKYPASSETERVNKAVDAILASYLDYK
jgi:hypothetical protein